LHQVGRDDQGVKGGLHGHVLVTETLISVAASSGGEKYVAGSRPGLGVSQSAARGISALVFARLYELNFASFGFSSFFGALFEN